MSNTTMNPSSSTSSITNMDADLSNNQHQISTLLQSLQAYHQNIEMYNRNISDLLYIIRINNTPPRASTPTPLQSNMPRTNTRTYNTFTLGGNRDTGRRTQSTTNTANRQLSQSEIAQYITTTIYENGMNDAVCPISLDDFVIGESICKINVCGHIFKERSLLQWVSTRNQCPVCRANIVSREHATVQDRSSNYADTDISGNIGNTLSSMRTFNDILDLFSTNTNTNPIEYIFDIPLYYDISANGARLSLGLL